MEYIQDNEAFTKYLYQNCHCCNAGQSKEERRLKYAIAKYLGKSTADARVFRDWNRNTFVKWFGYSSWDSYFTSLRRYRQ